MQKHYPTVIAGRDATPLVYQGDGSLPAIPRLTEEVADWMRKLYVALVEGKSGHHEEVRVAATAAAMGYIHCVFSAISVTVPVPRKKPTLPESCFVGSELKPKAK